jgi:hypothetical protein
VTGKRIAFVLGLGAVVVGIAAFAATGSSGNGVLEFNTMSPVVAPFTGAANPIRGINGGGVPWKLTSAKGELSSSGELELKVRGLVLAATGVNPVASFRGVVNCLTPASPMTGVSVATDPVATNTAGNVEIEARLTLPDPCIAPIVFVTNGGGAAPGAWFATTGTP